MQHSSTGPVSGRTDRNLTLTAVSVISKPRETDTMGFAHPGNKSKYVGNKGRRPVRKSVKGKKKKERKEQKSKTTKSVVFIDPLKSLGIRFSEN